MHFAAVPGSDSQVRGEHLHDHVTPTEVYHLHVCISASLNSHSLLTYKLVWIYNIAGWASGTCIQMLALTVLSRVHVQQEKGKVSSVHRAVKREAS